MKEDKENARPKERRGPAAGPAALLGTGSGTATGTATGTDGRAGGAEPDRLERPKDKKETLSKVGPARCWARGVTGLGRRAAEGRPRRGDRGGETGGRRGVGREGGKGSQWGGGAGPNGRRRRRRRAAGGDPPAAAQPDEGAAGGAPPAPARARLLRVLRQRLQVRPPDHPPTPPPRHRPSWLPRAAGVTHRAPRAATEVILGLWVLSFCSLYPHMFSRAYINFKNQEDIVLFRDRFDGYVFVDHKGK